MTDLTRIYARPKSRARLRKSEMITAYLATRATASNRVQRLNECYAEMTVTKQEYTMALIRWIRDNYGLSENGAKEMLVCLWMLQEKGKTK